MIKKLIFIFFVFHLFFPRITSSVFFFNAIGDGAATKGNDASCVSNWDCENNNFRDVLHVDISENHLALIQSILENLSDTSSDDESEYNKNRISSDASMVMKDSAAIGSAVVISNNIAVDDLETPTSGKRKIDQERDECVEEEPSKKYFRNDHKSRLIKNALAADLNKLFIQQTGDHLKNYYQYKILNYPVDSTKRGTNLTLNDVEMIRKVFDKLEFFRIPADGSSKKLPLKIFTPTKKSIKYHQKR